LKIVVNGGWGLEIFGEIGGRWMVRFGVVLPFRRLMIDWPYLRRVSPKNKWFKMAHLKDTACETQQGRLHLLRGELKGFWSVYRGAILI
jgi:hypothetical protein